MVIVEGMHHRIQKYKMSGYAAAVLSIKEYAAPLTAGMLTTVAAFFPLLFVKGIMGEFLKGIPIVVISTLISALFVAISIVPTIGSSILKPKKEGKEDQKEENSFSRIYNKINFFPKIIKFFTKIYGNKIESIIADRGNRLIVLISAWILLIISFAIIAISLQFPEANLIKIQSFGKVDQDEFWITLEMPQGTNLEQTNEIVKKIEEKVYELPEVENFVTSVGSGIGRSVDGGNQNVANIFINLNKQENREITSLEIAEIAREKLASITQGKVEVVELEEGPPGGATLEIKLVGEELVDLERISNDLKGILESLDGSENIKTDMEFLPGEFMINFNEDILSSYGLSPLQVALEIRNGISGNDSVEVKREGEEIDINLKYKKGEIQNINELKNLSINTPTGEVVALQEVAEISLESSISSITRIDEERTVRITGRNRDDIAPNEIIKKFQEKVKDYNLKEGYSIVYGGETEEQNEIYMDMFMKMLIGAVLIIFILVAQFNSYKQAFIIIITVPLSMIGVIWGMAITNLTLDIPAFIGIISLWGIVVNDSIILIDQINVFRKREDCNLVKAVVNAGKSRMQPILLTTSTTVFGLLPLSITEPGWRNMGFSIIFGLSFSTLLTLIIVPSLYVLLIKLRLKRKERNAEEIKNLKYSGFGLRLVSFFIDVSIVFVIYQFIGLIIELIGEKTGFTLIGHNFLTGILLYIIVHLAYFLSMTFFFERSLGKSITETAIVSKRKNQTQISFGQAIIRESLKLSGFLSLVLSLSGIGFLFNYFKPEEIEQVEEAASTAAEVLPEDVKLSLWMIILIILGILIAILYFVFYLITVFYSKKKSFHDRLAETMVVDDYQDPRKIKVC
jgi:HAE1 family hydrophobic/amphiphilic exporter-1